MKLPKTLRGYISLMSQIEKKLGPSNLKGFKKLPAELQELLGVLDAEISNCFNEFIDEYNEWKKTEK